MSVMKGGAFNNCTRTTGINWDCPRQTRKYGPPSLIRLPNLCVSVYSRCKMGMMVVLTS